MTKAIGRRQPASYLPSIDWRSQAHRLSGTQIETMRRTADTAEQPEARNDHQRPPRETAMTIATQREIKPSERLWRQPASWLGMR